MKSILGIAMIAVLLGAGLPATAQVGNWDYLGIPDLDKKQKAKLDLLWMEYQRTVLPIDAAMDKLQIETQVILSRNRPDMGLIEAKLVEYCTLKGGMLKAEMKFIVDLKEDLKPAQRNWLNQVILEGGLDEWMTSDDQDLESGPDFDSGPPGISGNGDQRFGDPHSSCGACQNGGCGDRPDGSARDEGKKGKKGKSGK